MFSCIREVNDILFSVLVLFRFSEGEYVVEVVVENSVG